MRAAGTEVVCSEVDEGAIRRFRDELGLEFLPPDAVCAMECDVSAPGSLGGVLNASTIPQPKSQAVVGEANNQLAEAKDAETLHARGILYAPDSVVNAGGAAFLLGVETQGWTQEQAEQAVVESVRRALRQVFELAVTQGITTHAAARQIAGEGMSAAR